MKNTVTKEPSTVMNGVPVDDLQATIHAVKENPDLGAACFRAKNRWMGQGLNETEIGSFQCAGAEHSHKRKFVFRNDEPAVLLGTDEAANPVEFILHALAGCVTTTTVYHAAVRGIRIQEIETFLEGDLDLRGLLQINPKVPSGYQDIRVRMNIKSDTNSEGAKVLKELFSLSPVFDTLTRAVQVDVDVHVSQ